MGGKKTFKLTYINSNMSRYLPKDVAVIREPSINVEHKIDNNKITKKLYSKIIMDFIRVIKASFDDSHLNNFYHNINDLKVSEFEQYKDGTSNIGYYDNFNNTVEIAKGYTSLGIMIHELFHMASSIISGDVVFSGFRQYNRHTKVNYGYGLDEGYTQLLTERYFNVPNEGRYTFLVRIAELLEMIVGKEKMEGLYLESSLYKLIKELREYISVEEIMQFIADLDFIKEYLPKKWLLPNKRNRLTQSLKNVNRFLLICYIRATKKKLNNKEISSLESGNRIYNFAFYELPSELKINNNKFDLLPDEEIQRYINEGLEPYTKIKNRR